MKSVLNITTSEWFSIGETNIFRIMYYKSLKWLYRSHFSSLSGCARCSRRTIAPVNYKVDETGRTKWYSWRKSKSNATTFQLFTWEILLQNCSIALHTQLHNGCNRWLIKTQQESLEHTLQSMQILFLNISLVLKTIQQSTSYKYLLPIAMIINNNGNQHLIIR